MRKMICLTVLAVLLLPLSYSYGADEKGKDASKCQTLTKEDVTMLLKDMVPNLIVLEVRDSPVQSLCETTFESGGRRNVAYLDISKKYLFGGSIIELASRTNLTQARFEEINKVDPSKIPLEDALVMGDKNAKHKIIVFDDPV